MNPGPRREYPVESGDALRHAAFDLRAKSAAVPGLIFFPTIRLVPAERSILQASENLIGLSNSLFGGDDYRKTNEERRLAIIAALRLHVWTAESSNNG